VVKPTTRNRIKEPPKEPDGLENVVAYLSAFDEKNRFRDLRDGQHRNPTGNPAFFAEAFFHRPERLRRDVRRAGFAPVDLVMVDPFAYSYKDIDRYWDDPARRERLMGLLRRLESEPSLLGAGPHMMCVARKPA